VPLDSGKVIAHPPTQADTAEPPETALTEEATDDQLNPHYPTAGQRWEPENLRDMATSSEE